MRSSLLSLWEHTSTTIAVLEQEILNEETEVGSGDIEERQRATRRQSDNILRERAMWLCWLGKNVVWVSLAGRVYLGALYLLISLKCVIFHVDMAAAAKARKAILENDKWRTFWRETSEISSYFRGKLYIERPSIFCPHSECGNCCDLLTFPTNLLALPGNLHGKRWFFNSRNSWGRK